VGTENTQMLIRLVVGLSATTIVGFFAARRVFWLYRMIMASQPATGRTTNLLTRIWTQVSEVAGQSRLLKWSIPGLAHFFTMWAFIVLLTVYIEAYGLLFNQRFHLPIIGTSDVLGFLQDFFITAVTLAIVAFMIIRIIRNPREIGRASRFYGSHTGGAWLILIMILNVVWTFLLLRGAAVNNDTLPYGNGAYLSQLMGVIMKPLGTANETIETVALLLHIGVMLAFLIIVLHSKHLHIFLAPINVVFKRLPDGMGELLPIEYEGKPIDFEDPPEDAVFGRGKIEDFTWKGMLDFATCTECGRCQSQCPAWNTGKPLSPKLLIMDLRDHWMAKAPYLLGEKEEPTGDVDLTSAPQAEGHHVPEQGFPRIGGSGPAQAARPLVGTEEQGGVIDPDVLWSCTNCGACVEQCPVDIEHVDHILDMRRYQVMVESEFPSELSALFKNLETKGNPWGQNASQRTAWIDEVDFDVPVYGQDVDSFEGYEYLFWVGCAGAFEDRAKKTTKAVAELLAIAGVKYLVLGTGETCNGDPARRSGNEFLYQQLAAQNVETLNDVFEGVEAVDRKIITSCPHCFNTLGREYPQLGTNYTVLHHSQLLNRLIRDKKLVPVSPVSQDITYHDPCFLGRHNKVYDPPRELVTASGANLVEMPRHRDRALCCGAGGARMWMEEHIGKRVNHERVDEALATGAATIATACPFCRVMITDGVDDRQEVAGREGVEVRDIAQLLLQSLDHSTVTLPEKGTAAKQAAASAPAKPAPPATATATMEKPASAPAEAEAPAEAKAPAEAGKAKASAAPVKGLGIAGGAKRPGAKKPAAQASSPATAKPPEESAQTPAPAKGLGIAAGAKRPGAKKAAAPAQPTAEPAEPATAAEPTQASEPTRTAEAAPVKGLGIAAGAKRPGAKETAAPKTEPEAETAAEPAPKADESAAEDESESTPKPGAPVKGLGIAKGARPPGKH
jgi:Fe-S oxidoreductase